MIRNKTICSLLLLMLVLSVGWIISPAFVSQQNGDNGSNGTATGRPTPRQAPLPAAQEPLAGTSASGAFPGGALSGQSVPGRVIVSQNVKHDVSPPLSSIEPAPAQDKPRREHEQGRLPV